VHDFPEQGRCAVMVLLAGVLSLGEFTIWQRAVRLNPGSSLLPDQSRQPPPEGAHAPADLFAGPAVAKVENLFSTCFHPHCGHFGGSAWRVKTSFSKTCPHLEQEYSKIGIADRSHSLGLISQIFGSDFPTGVFRRPAQVKREMPGMRGRTRNQTTRKRTKTK
jgi:hypothetical protein